jgi:hypothetical protein
MEPEPQTSIGRGPPEEQEVVQAADQHQVDKEEKAEAIAEACAAAAAAAKVGGRHIVVTGHPVPEFCQRYSLRSSPAEGEAGTGDGKRAVAFENLRGLVLFWHVASQSWVFGFGHKQQTLTEEELAKCATLSLPAGNTGALHGAQTWDHKGVAVEITLTAFEDEKSAKESVEARPHSWSSFDTRFCADKAGDFQASPSDETMNGALACIPEYKALLEST